jgi:rhomboid domain-containing protein 1
MGSIAFSQLVVFSLLASHCLLVGLSYLLYMYTDITSSYHSCAVGFSAVLFSLKYVLNQSEPSRSNVMGIQVASRYAAWFELVLVSLIHPNVSFVGHLSGILAGILYVHGMPLVERSLRRSAFGAQGRRVRGTWV